MCATPDGEKTGPWRRKSVCVTPDGEKTEPELKKPLTKYGDEKNVGLPAKGSATAPVMGIAER